MPKVTRPYWEVPVGFRPPRHPPGHTTTFWRNRVSRIPRHHPARERFFSPGRNGATPCPQRDAGAYRACSTGIRSGTSRSWRPSDSLRAWTYISLYRTATVRSRCALPCRRSLMRLPGILVHISCTWNRNPGDRNRSVCREEEADPW